MGREGGDVVVEDEEDEVEPVAGEDARAREASRRVKQSRSRRRVELQQYS